MNAEVPLSQRLRAVALQEFRAQQRGEWVDTASPKEIDEAICDTFLPLFTSFSDEEALGARLSEDYGEALGASGQELVGALEELVVSSWDAMTDEGRGRFSEGGHRRIEQIRTPPG